MLPLKNHLPLCKLSIILEKSFTWISKEIMQKRNNEIEISKMNGKIPSSRWDESGTSIENRQPSLSPRPKN